MTTSGLRLTKDEACAADIQAHLDRCNQRFRPPLSTRLKIPAYARKIRDKAHTFEAWMGEALIGLVAAYMNEEDRTCHITSVSVIEEFSGQGIAGQLLEACLGQARACRLSSASLEVSNQSQIARHVYEKYGFRVQLNLGGKLFMRRMNLAA
jgi:ribosomal-protein-alanine N-acetyltransferase